jgi:hypothetical protein
LTRYWRLVSRKKPHGFGSESESDVRPAEIRQPRKNHGTGFSPAHGPFFSLEEFERYRQRVWHARRLKGVLDNG